MKVFEGVGTFFKKFPRKNSDEKNSDEKNSHEKTKENTNAK